MKRPKNIGWVYIAKGIGIILVVTGHFTPESSPEYWQHVRKIIYTFHMPLFFLLSGYLFYLTKKAYYLTHIKNKIERLVVPFFSIAFLFFFIKYAVQQFMNLQHPVELDNLVTLLVNPADSYMPLLWFIHALFLIFIFYPLFERLCPNLLFLLFFFLLLNEIIQNGFSNQIIAHNSIIKALANLPFFVTGVLTAHFESIASKKLYRYIFIFFGIGIVIVTIILKYDIYLSRFIYGITGSFIVIKLSTIINRLSSSKMLGFEILNKNIYAVGVYSMSIYLFHTLFESFVRILTFSLFPSISVKLPFILIAMVAITCGVLFPLLLEKYILRSFSITRRLFLGLK